MSASDDDDDDDDDDAYARLKPDPTVEQVIDAVRLHFFDARRDVDIRLVKDLDSYDDRNLWIRADGIDYLTKIHNGVESRDLIRCRRLGDDDDDDEKGKNAGGSTENNNCRRSSPSAIHLQHKIMTHLLEQGIATNRPVKKTTSGNYPYFAVVSLPVRSREDSPHPLVLRLLGWVDGRTMSSCETIPIESLADAGRFLGRLGMALSALPPDDGADAASLGAAAAAGRYHPWDGRNTADLRGFAKYVADDRRRSIVESVVETFQETILDEGVVFETSLIHNDFTHTNFLLDGDYCVSGVIDFGDLVESWTILDLSVAMAHSMLTSFGRRKRSLSAAAAMLRGYHSVRPVSETERSHLILLIACRLSCTVARGAYSHARNPGNGYILRLAVPAWNALELVWGETDPPRRAAAHETIRGLFDRACGGGGNASVADDAGHPSGPGAVVIDCSDLDFPDPSVPDPLAASRSSSATGS